MLSIFAPHFFNWTKQLEDSGHEVYWLDVFDSNTEVAQIEFVGQITGWRYKWDFPGRYFLKNQMPGLNNFINKFNERELAEVFNQKLQEIEPDLVHMFVMHLSCFPIQKIINRNLKIKWAYSSWGSDLYYYKDKKAAAEKIKKILPSINFMFSDCYRDFQIAKDLGFSGEFLGVFPGGGGYDFNRLNPFITSLPSRNTILIKGYQGKHGRCVQVLKAMVALKPDCSNYNIVVFGGNEEVKSFILGSELKDWNNLKILGRIPHSEVIKLMGQSLVYIGNSLSDGMPNTLLEAIIMGAFPIQSNPGGATAELIIDGRNGKLIHDPENPQEIETKLRSVLNNDSHLEEGVEYNLKIIKPSLERNTIKKQVLKKYQYIEDQL